MRWVLEQRTDAADGDGLIFEHPREIVPLCRGEHFVAFRQCESMDMAERPGGLGPSRLILQQRGTTQTVGRDQGR
jgi:hypothetical protein